MGAALLCTVYRCGADISASVSLEDPKTESATTGEILFSDVKLDFYMRSVVGKRRPARLVLSDVNTITSLNLDSLGIASLQGLQHLKSLKTLSLVSNAVMRVDNLASLTDLERLDLRHNRVISVASIRFLTSLKELQLDHNLIMDVGPLSENGGLGEGDHVTLTDNPFACDAAAQHLGVLKKRGVRLISDCP